MSGRSFIALVISWVLVGSVAAQDPPVDPFGDASSVSPVVTRTPAKTAEKPEPVETDPHVLAIRRSQPQSPAELVTAVQNLLNFGRPDEAQKYLKQLLAATPDDATLWSLQRKFGTAVFLRISAVKELAPEGQQLSDAVLNAANKALQDPARLDGLIQQLGDSSIDVRRVAVADLKMSGEHGAAALIAVLGDPARSAEHPIARAALAYLGDDAIAPSLGVLDAADNQVRVQVLWALSKLRAREAIPFLLRPALTDEQPAPRLSAAAQEALSELLTRLPSRSEAEHYLHRRALAYFDGQVPQETDESNQVRSWRWDAATGRPIVEKISEQRASLRMAALLAGELVALTSDGGSYLPLRMTAQLELAQLARGWTQSLDKNDPAYRAAVQMGPPRVEEVAAFALDHHHPAAVVAALRILGDIGTVELVQNAASRLSVTCRALNDADRRVRFASVQTVMRWDPRQSYAGASFLPESLGYFANNSGTRRALIVQPRLELARTLAGILTDLGYSATTAVSPTEALQLAAEQSDIEVVLVSDAINYPGVREWLQQLRREPRSASLPVAVLAREENLARMQRMTDEDPLSMAFPAPYERPAMAFLISRMLEPLGDDYVGPEERLQHSAAALEYLGKLAEQPQRYGFYDLVRQQPAVERALANPHLTVPACPVLGGLATPASQRLLVSVASQNDRAMIERQSAVKAFDAAVKQRGVLLTRSEILAQYDRYNASEALDVETQQVLGAILDSIEAPVASEGPR